MRSVAAFVIRDGDWKLCLCPGSGVHAGMENAKGNDPLPEVAWRKALDQFGEEGKITEDLLTKPPFVQLFNLAEDLSQTNDLSESNPEKTKELFAKFKKFVASRELK